LVRRSSIHIIPGHEYLEFELQPSGKLQYSNDSGYRGGYAINKEVTISPAVVEEIRRMVLESRIESVDDSTWERMKDRATRRQELEIKIGNEHLAFTCPEILSLLDVEKSPDPQGMKLFYYLAQDVKCLVFSLISLHFKLNPFA
jgi:protein mago nashi